MHVAEPGHIQHNMTNFMENPFPAIESPRDNAKESGSNLCQIREYWNKP